VLPRVACCVVTLCFPTFERIVPIQETTARHTGIAQPHDNYMTMERSGREGAILIDFQTAAVGTLKKYGLVLRDLLFI